jgi:hypothetical protein
MGESSLSLSRRWSLSTPPQLSLSYCMILVQPHTLYNHTLYYYSTTMKSSKASTISNPMSRNKKHGSAAKFSSGSIVRVLIGLMVIIFGVFYLTVYQGMMASNSINPHLRNDLHPEQGMRADELINGIPHPALGHLKRHHPSKDQVSMEYLHAYHGTVILHLEGLGDVTIHTRADWSMESVVFVHDLAENGNCERCNFYRSEKPGIFQGMMVSPTHVPKVDVKGPCPPQFDDKQQACPPHDPNCACHGPIMERGMVGWAGGGTGPDFFIDMYPNPAKFWGNQHT